MIPPWLDSLLPLITAIVGGLVVHGFRRRKVSAEIVASESATADRLYALVSDLRAKTLAAEDECERLKERCEELEGQLRRHPIARLADQLRQLNGLAHWFDRLGVPIVVSTADGGGTFVYVSPEFCALLGRTREDVLASAWTTLVHPEDLRRTRAVEASAWTQPVQVVNRYRHSDGTWKRLRWDCGAYIEDITLCRVMEE